MLNRRSTGAMDGRGVFETTSSP
jgi:hypothetical protein